MSCKILLVGLAACGLASAGSRNRPSSPWSPPNHDKGVSYNANFDDLAATPASLVPVGNYDGLDYNSFFVATTGLTGVRPHSSPNAAAYGVYGMALQGTPSITPIQQGATFDLQSAYFGCAVNSAETAAGVATACTVTVSGFKGNTEVANQVFTFSPSGLVDLEAPMQFIEFGSWARGLSKATFTTTDGTLIGTLFDNFQYTIYSS